MTPVLDPEGAHLATLRRLGDFRGKRVLELGCGDGRLTVGIAPDAAHVLAFDPDAEAVERARRSLPADARERVSYRVASGKEIEIEPHSFDLTVFSWSLCCVEPEDVAHVLRNMVSAIKPGGLVFDLQVIRPNPVVVADGQILCEIDGSPLFRTADAATAAVDDLIARERLVEQAIDDHDVRKHYANGAELVEDFIGEERRLPEGALPSLSGLAQRCAVRERCRLRRLEVRPLAT
jgi:2-polyprenyl-3-methyl-5-hydroxy-6-metoxy-1,4-benzoquinol methylase